MARFRIRLTHFYHEVTPRELYRVVTEHLEDIERIVEELTGAAGRLAEGAGRST